MRKEPQDWLRVRSHRLDPDIAEGALVRLDGELLRQDPEGLDHPFPGAGRQLGHPGTQQFVKAHVDLPAIENQVARRRLHNEFRFGPRIVPLRTELELDGPFLRPGHRQPRTDFHQFNRPGSRLVGEHERMPGQIQQGPRTVKCVVLGAPRRITAYVHRKLAVLLGEVRHLRVALLQPLERYPAPLAQFSLGRNGPLDGLEIPTVVVDGQAPDQLLLCSGFLLGSLLLFSLPGKLVAQAFEGQDSPLPRLGRTEGGRERPRFRPEPGPVSSGLLFLSRRRIAQPGIAQGRRLGSQPERADPLRPLAQTLQGRRTINPAQVFTGHQVSQHEKKQVAKAGIGIAQPGRRNPLELASEANHLSPGHDLAQIPESIKTDLPARIHPGAQVGKLRRRGQFLRTAFPQE